MGFPADLGFFFPLALSRCSRCFSFASVVSPLAALRTSTSRSGAARARTWFSTKAAYNGLSWCRLMTCAMIASENAIKSSLDLGVDFRISSRSASVDEPNPRPGLESTRGNARSAGATAHARTLDGGRPEELSSITEIRLELALLLEPRLGTRIEHRVLIIIQRVILLCELGLARGLLLCELLLESSLLPRRSYRRSGGCRFLVFLFFGGCFPIALQRLYRSGKDIPNMHTVGGAHDRLIAILVLPFPFALDYSSLVGYRRAVLGTLYPDSQQRMAG